jgi:carboxyl-terminal processing protease
VADHTENSDSNSKKPFELRKMAATLSVAAVIFLFGVGVGNGQVQFGFGESANNVANNELPEDLDYTDVEKVYDVLRKNFDGELTVDQLMQGLKGGLARATDDPYTEYLSAEESKEFQDDLDGTFSGIGAELSKEESSIVIVAPIAGFPAEEAGLQPRDVVAEIDGENAYDISVTEAVRKIRGEAGTDVELTIIRGGSERLEFTITRAQITIPSVEHEILEGNIGYIKISRFSDDTARLTRQAATEFLNSDVAGVILDVRSNPGGLLDSSVSVSNVWLPQGATVLEEKRGGVTIKTFSTTGAPILEGVPTIVLINEGSASASEIVAGALRDNGAATLIGQQSFGKGSVQSLERLPGGATLKVTIARWFTPNNQNIDKEGIWPDKEVELTAEDIEADRDPQLDAALEQLRR